MHALRRQETLHREAESVEAVLQIFAQGLEDGSSHMGMNIDKARHYNMSLNIPTFNLAVHFRGIAFSDTDDAIIFHQNPAFLVDFVLIVFGNDMAAIK